MPRMRRDLARASEARKACGPPLLAGKRECFSANGAGELPRHTPQGPPAHPWRLEAPWSEQSVSHPSEEVLGQSQRPSLPRNAVSNAGLTLAANLIAVTDIPVIVANQRFPVGVPRLES